MAAGGGVPARLGGHVCSPSLGGVTGLSVLAPWSLWSLKSDGRTVRLLLSVSDMAPRWLPGSGCCFGLGNACGFCFGFDFCFWFGFRFWALVGLWHWVGIWLWVWLYFWLWLRLCFFLWFLLCLWILF